MQIDAAPAPEEWTAPLPDALDLVVEADALIAIVTAQRYARIDAMRREALDDARRHGFAPNDVIERSVRLELAAALSITEASAGALIAQSEALVHRYPGVLDSLGGARITQRHATDLVEAMDAVESELREELLPGALALAESLPVGSFRRKLRRLIDDARVATLTERHERALESRRAALQIEADGMAWLTLFVPAVEAQAIYARATAMAKVLRASEGETRTLDQLRADVISDLLVDGVTDALPAEARGIRATAVVTVPVLALLDGDAAAGSGTASVEGAGPIPIGRARELCGGAEGWMRVLTHPENGTVLSVGRDRYRPPPELRRLVRWRAETCMAPGCGIPASRCEIDHTIAWEHSGATSLDNLAPLCKGHHTVKHHGRWCVSQIPDSGGALQWVSPTGRRYRVEPERRVPVFRPADDRPPPF